MRRVGIVLVSGALLCAVWSGVSAAAPRPFPLSARLVQHGEFAGLILGAPVSYKNFREYIAAVSGLSPAMASAEVAQARREGFKALMYEGLFDAQDRPKGTSWVVQYGSAAMAQAGLTTTIHFATMQKSETRERLRVAAIPGALGIRGGSGDTRGESVLFADGPFVYEVSDSWTGSAHNPRHAALLEAATKLYERVHGHPAG